MLERQLTDELHRVADAVPVPDDLFPAALKLKRAGARRRPWALVAAAAVALVVLGFTPLGQKAVVATTEWVMTYTVKVYRGVAPHRSVDVRAIPVGETVEEQVDRIRRVHRGMAVADLTDWPLPTYLGPDPSDKAVVTEDYREDGTLIATHLTMDWQVAELGAHKMIGWNVSRGSIPEQQREDIRSGKEPGVTIYGAKDLTVTQQTVTFKGHEATATLANTTWMLDWWHEGGSGHLYGNIPLEELLKVAESLPTVENVTP